MELWCAVVCRCCSRVGLGRGDGEWTLRIDER